MSFNFMAAITICSDFGAPKNTGISYPMSEVRGGGREKQPHFRGAMAARVQEGLKELSHVESQEGWQ